MLRSSKHPLLSLLLFAFLAVLLACRSVTLEPEKLEEQKTTNVVVTLAEIGLDNWYVCSDDPFEVDLHELLPSIPDGDTGEQREQVRDWMWTMAMARHAKVGGSPLR